ncbi:hypothetical protein CLOP_g8587 [Closterium sp. NIES-67]|nr:hypothetical protein CLOP_g8587 [Closterium sp. NIES-67]
MQQFYYWPDMVTDVQRYVATCPIFQRIKSSHQRSTGLLQPLEPPQRPWQHVTMDFVRYRSAGRIQQKRHSLDCCRLIDENGAFRTMLYNHHSRRNRATVHLDRCSPTRDTSSNHQRSRPEVHVEILAGHVGSVRHTPAILIRLSSPNGQSDKQDEPDDGAADSDKLPQPKQMGGRASHVGIFLQQCALSYD